MALGLHPMRKLQPEFGEGRRLPGSLSATSLRQGSGSHALCNSGPWWTEAAAAALSRCLGLSSGASRLVGSVRQEPVLRASMPCVCRVCVCCGEGLQIQGNRGFFLLSQPLPGGGCSVVCYLIGPQLPGYPSKAVPWSRTLPKPPTSHGKVSQLLSLALKVPCEQAASSTLPFG